MKTFLSLKILGVISILSSIFCCPSALGANSIWLKLTASLHYSSEHNTCKATGVNGNHFYLHAIVSDGKSSRIALHNFPRIFPYLPIHRSIVFPKALAETVVFYRDRADRFWLKEFPLNDKLLKWVLYYPGEREFFCRVPTVVDQVTPEKVTFSFETDDLDDEILISHSQRVNVSAVTLAQVPFEAGLKLIQREARVWEWSSLPIDSFPPGEL